MSAKPAQNLPPDSPSENDGIELLVKMAQTGQIDPWNVDIVQVADQYLQAVAELKETDLKRTGKTLLYLAILLRMKSDQLAGIDFLNALEDAEWDDLGEPAPGEDMALMRINPLPIRGMVTSLDEAIKRRTSTKQPRIRPVTLEDLIQELRKYEELEKKRSLREKVEKASQRRVADYSQFTSDDIEDLAHEEFIEDTIFHLKDLLERILVKEEQVSLSQLHQSNLQGRGQMDKISAFIALLFLDLRGDVEIFQQEFYGELFIRKAPPAPLPGSADTPPDAVGDDTMELAG